ncbi:unnamed protein product, partial [Meganyctiphanes norvegica]
YEDPRMREGFNFTLQVTDRGRGGWSDSRHTDEASIVVRLQDVNDNAPVFANPHVNLTVPEDMSTGTLLTTIAATDADMGGQQGVDYRLVGGWGALRVDRGGEVVLWRPLDREGEVGAVGKALIVAEDRGRPPLSATATLTLTLTDVNDTPPRLLVSVKTH